MLDMKIRGATEHQASGPDGKPSVPAGTSRPEKIPHQGTENGAVLKENAVLAFQARHNLGAPKEDHAGFARSVRCRRERLEAVCEG